MYDGSFELTNSEQLSKQQCGVLLHFLAELQYFYTNNNNNNNNNNNRLIAFVICYEAIM